MEENFREHYFIVLRIAILFMLEMYITLSKLILTGISAKIFLFLALFLGINAGKELVEQRYRILVLAAAGLLLLLGWFLLGTTISLLAIFLCYEVLEYVRPRFPWYLLPLGMEFVFQSDHFGVEILLTFLIGILYVQHDFVVDSYQKQAKEDIMVEQTLKHDLNQREHEMQEEVRKSFLQAENQLLEEREALSQTLHDRLGHSINGSVYQLEAVKVLMEKEPEVSRKMLQSVIEQLRSGMDEIRQILRKERPKKYKLAILQLEQLGEECRSKGVEAELVIEGELKEIPEKYLEVILDNAYEAVSNSMKYAKCSEIKIGIYVLHQMVRCSISDNGIGCKEIVDGMGISGMRKRMRQMNGILDFETEAGFTINMLLPL